MGAFDKLKHAWNAFNGSPVEESYNPSNFPTNFSYSVARPDHVRMNISNEKSIVSAIYNRLAVDVSSVVFRHVRLDDQERFKELMIKSALNNCLAVEANVDQDPRALFQDIALTMFDRGVVAVVPVDTTLNPMDTGGFDINSMRVGHIVQWFPRHVRVSVWDDREEEGGRRREVTLEKKFVAIVQNPFYAVMNEKSSTLQRLIRKLNLLDAIDEQAGSGKLDLIIQLPYTIRNEQRRIQAESRRADIEMQLRDGKYGIAYTDGTEKITQLNRPTENNLMATIEYLRNELYDQLGLTPEIMNGTATEEAMLNYYSRTIEPILDALVGEMKRKFLTKTARSQGQSIMYFQDQFKLVPVSKIAEIANSLARNEILTPNEFRAILGYKPSTDKKADELRNSNMPAPSEPVNPPATPEQEGDSQNGS